MTQTSHYNVDEQCSGADTVKRFNNICLISQNVSRMRDFYRQVLQTETEGDDTFAVIKTEGAGLSIFWQQGMEQMAPGCTAGAAPGGFTLEFEVDDVDTEYERLIALGVEIVKPPTTQPWGWRSTWFRDPDGNIVNFCTNLGDT
jgi:predicted enzyme related to lactoylglutathione lyase